MGQHDLTCEQRESGEYASGNIFLRHVRLAKAGDVLQGHTHHFDHTTFVVSGRVRIHATCDKGCRPRTQEFAPGESFLVRKDWRHEATALSDDVHFVCVYSHRDAQGEVVQVMEGWRDGVLEDYR